MLSNFGPACEWTLSNKINLILPTNVTNVIEIAHVNKPLDSIKIKTVKKLMMKAIDVHTSFRGGQYLMGENVIVVWAEFSTLV